MEIPYYHINSFAKTIFSGNLAGVCLLHELLSDEVLLNIASENRQSQTAFVVSRPRSKSDFDLRWFTPVTEDDLCGHATLVAAFVLNHIGETQWPIRFHTRSGILEVDRDENAFVMDFPAWSPQPCDVPEELLPALGVQNAEVYRTRDYLVFVEASEQVQNLKPDLRALKELKSGIGGGDYDVAGLRRGGLCITVFCTGCGD